MWYQYYNSTITLIKKWNSIVIAYDFEALNYGSVFQGPLVHLICELYWLWLTLWLYSQGVEENKPSKIRHLFSKIVESFTALLAIVFTCQQNSFAI